MQNLIELIKGVQGLPATVMQEPNFFSIGGTGYFENPTSDLLAIFMGGQGGTPTWLAKALVYCLVDQGHFSQDAFDLCEWNELFVEREVSINDELTDTYKRLDLLVTGAAFVLGIEHKVYASAAANPFDVYDQLLQSRSEGKTIIKCVLRPSKYAADIRGDWPVVSYDELIVKAKLFYGSDIAFTPISKWQFFYTEFLQHLYGLAHPENENPMDKQSFDFVIQHFITLRKGRNLLDDFEKQLLHQGSATVSKVLQELGVETNIVTRSHTWGEAKALRFRPECWGGESDVVLAFYGNEDDAEQPINFYIRAYIKKGSEKVDFDTISKELSHRTAKKLDLWEDDKNVESNHCWQERDGKYLCFGAYAKDRTLEGTLQALASLTKWLQLNAYSTVELA
ncbi:PD-(D/E)XK nuclease family protein [Deefgea piscis]|uniref:PD-(D/E)XK nuclease family protein n=1 Tax=Deefgea piscis TaxID=2739061 RepID=A0A6M8SUU1_9NEIS|nr:PD-(D/E)XK nuclease family protein [Deefgea piscis]QKJ67316.1 PD-(D/E)XK nuclease family protein [Deefgea piscis]